MKSILVQADTSLACENRLGLSLKLAQAFDAHLTALHVTPNYTVPVYAEAPIGPDIIDAVRRSGRKNAARAKSMLESLKSDYSVETSWRDVDGDIVDTLCGYSHCADVAVLGQYNPDDPRDANPGVIEHVLIEAGRPCLVVPYIKDSYDLMSTVLVAWNGTREAARAVKDAMPIMCKAKRVEVLWVNPKQDPEEYNGENVCAYLSRHGINVELSRLHNEEIPTGDTLLSHAADVSAELIVTGAYGHTRLREKILGGVTRHLLEHMTVPVLMSH